MKVSTSLVGRLERPPWSIVRKYLCGVSWIDFNNAADDCCERGEY